MPTLVMKIYSKAAAYQSKALEILIFKKRFQLEESKSTYKSSPGALSLENTKLKEM